MVEKILIENKTAIKLAAYTHHAPGEVSGMGKSVITEDGEIMLIDIALFDQECGSASTNLDTGAMAKFMYDMSKAKESLKDWNVWWHTHGDLGVSWSTTDDDTIKEHVKDNKKLISIVTNKEGKFLGRIDVLPLDPSDFGLVFAPHETKVDVEILIDEDLDKVIEETVSKLEEEQSALEDEISKKDDEIAETKKLLFYCPEIYSECEAEVKAKVREKVYKVERTYEKSKKKTQDSFFGRTDKATFENKLDDIIYGVDDRRCEECERLEESDEEIIFCPDCYNPVTFCICDDYYEKYGNLYGDEYDAVNGYIANSYKNVNDSSEEDDIIDSDIKGLGNGHELKQ